ncbi:uncharacterized protein LOC129987614 [Argiope bruennichi]|nr:uncharacterized protein LOC129987614 [Argiope bruennichi]
MALILLFSIIFASAESLYIDDSDAFSNLFAKEISNATFDNGTHEIDALRFLSSTNIKHVNGSVSSSNVTMLNTNNSTKKNDSEPVMKRIVEDIDDFQVDTVSANVTATESKLDGMSDQVANELSSGALIDNSNDLFMTRFLFDGFPEFWHRNKRNDSSVEPKRNMKKRFTFFRRFILI